MYTYGIPTYINSSEYKYTHFLLQFEIPADKCPCICQISGSRSWFWAYRILSITIYRVWCDGFGDGSWTSYFQFRCGDASWKHYSRLESRTYRDQGSLFFSLPTTKAPHIVIRDIVREGRGDVRGRCEGCVSAHWNFTMVAAAHPPQNGLKHLFYKKSAFTNLGRLCVSRKILLSCSPHPSWKNRNGAPDWIDEVNTK